MTGTVICNFMKEGGVCTIRYGFGSCEGDSCIFMKILNSQQTKGKQ